MAEAQKTSLHGKEEEWEMDPGSGAAETVVFLSVTHSQALEFRPVRN